MIFISLLLYMFSYSNNVDFQSARNQFLNDIKDYNFSTNAYIQEATKYRNIKMSEEYRKRIVKLEKELVKGNKEVLSTVDLYKGKNKDRILLDDVLLMRLAQLEFEKANFEYNESSNKVNSTVIMPNYAKCIEYTTQLLRQYPESTLADSAEYMIAYIYEEQAEFKKAEAIYSYFLKKYPVSKYFDEVQWRLAELQFESDNIKEARRNYLALAKRENSKFEFKALYKLGASLFETGLFSWSSKMFVRLYDRLKDDTASSAERSTLYDETLEYIGLLQRKGVALKLDPEIEALSAKKIQTIFARHGLWKESEKVISEYVEKYPNSKYLPEMYSRWISLYDDRKLLDKAEEIRNEYFAKLLDNKNWWLANRNNYQQRFIAEEEIEVNLVSSARYLVSKKRWDLAIARYKSFLDKYPFDPKSIDVRVELAEIYYTQSKYKIAYETLEEMPVIEMSKSQSDNYYFVKLSSYYAMNIKNTSQEISSTMAFLASQLLHNVQNLDRAASIIKPVAEYFSARRSYKQAADILMQYPYNRIEYSTKSIINLLDSHITIDKKGNEAKEVERLQQAKLDISMRKILNLRKFVSKSFLVTYDDLSYYLSVSDLEKFEQVPMQKTAAVDKEVYNLLKAQLLRGKGKFVASNALLSEVQSKSLSDYRNFLSAKNLYDLVDFSGCADLVTSIRSKNFKSDYPEYYKLRYDLALITAGPVAANLASIQLAKAINSDIPIVDHMFRLPSNERLKYLSSTNKNIRGSFLEAYHSKKLCSGTSECSYVTWFKTKDKGSIAGVVVDALIQSTDARWLLAVISDITERNISSDKTALNTKIKEWLQQNQFRFSVASNYKLIDMLNSWGIKTKDIVLPWDIAMYEWLEWQGLPATTGELQILLQEEKYTELENKLILNSQRKTFDSGINLLRFYLFTQNKIKAQEAFGDLTEYMDSEAYSAMSYILGFSEAGNQFESDDNAMITAARAKLSVENGNTREAIKLLSNAIKQNPNETIYYYGLLQSLLLIRDYTAASVVVKKALLNTNSSFASIADTVLNGVTYNKSGLLSIDSLAENLVTGVDVKIPVAAMTTYLALAKSWLTGSDANVQATTDDFEGLSYMYSATTNKKIDTLKSTYFSKSLDKIQRNIASEVEK